MKIQIPESHASLVPRALAHIGLRLTGELGKDLVWKTGPLPACCKCGAKAPALIGDKPFCSEHYIEAAKQEGLL